MCIRDRRITAARKEKKLTQEQVAQAMGVSRQTVSHWENGRVEPTQEQREALCRLLEISADAPQPTPLHRRILAAVALAAFVTILVMAVYPIYKSRHAGANPEACLLYTSIRREGDLAQFSVLDNGAGIEPAVLPKLFEEMFPHAGELRGDGRRSMGIGLSVCMSIVRAHGGTMKAKNRATGGACVSFVLPMGEE